VRISSYRTWCFDLDGTLLDQQARYTQIYCALVTRLGGKPVSDYWSMRKAGLSELDVFLRSGLSLSNLPAYDHMREEELENVHYLKFDTPFPNTLRLLEVLSSLNMAIWVVSHRSSYERLSDQLASLKLNKLIAGCICTKQYCDSADNTTLALSAEGAKVASRAKARALQKLGDASQIVMVGDSPSDIVAAHLAGVDSIAITTGCHPREMLEKEGPDLVCSTLQDLLVMISGTSL